MAVPMRKMAPTDTTGMKTGATSVKAARGSLFSRKVAGPQM